MTSQMLAFESGHKEMVHDAQLDYYGKRLATASSDRSIRIFEILPNQEHKLVEQLNGHDGPVWQVAWAHPKFGMLLASCSYDGKVCLWKEQPANQWNKVFEQSLSQQQVSVNSISWAPHTVGLVLAAACSDGSVWVFTHRDDQQWDSVKFPAHHTACHAVSWCCDNSSVLAAQQPDGPLKQLVTGGGDNCVKAWRCGVNGQWELDCNLGAHRDWVRDVACAPSLGLPRNTVASCSEDKTVAIWQKEQGGTWRKSKELAFQHKVWRVSWSPMGCVLAVSQGDNRVSLWKEAIDGEWQNLSNLEE